MTAPAVVRIGRGVDALKGGRWPLVWVIVPWAREPVLDVHVIPLWLN